MQNRSLIAHQRHVGPRVIAASIGVVCPGAGEVSRVASLATRFRRRYDGMDAMRRRRTH